MYRKITGLLVTAAVIAMLAPLAWSASETEKDADDRVAVVNGEPIGRAALEQEMTPIRQRMGMAGQKVDKTKLDEIRQQVLNNLIQRELVFQESQEKGFSIEDSVVEKQVATLKSRFPNPEEFQKRMGQMGITEDTLKLQIREQMTIQKFVESRIVDKIQVTEAEAREFYEKNPDQFKESEKLHARHILIKAEKDADDATRAAAKKRLEEVQQKLEKGGDFQKLAKEFSECPSNAEGGDLGFFGRGQMVKPFEEAAFALKPGEVSGIVETRFGYHLIELLEEKAASTKTFADAQPQIEQMLKNQRIKAELDQYIQNLRDKAEIKILI